MGSHQSTQTSPKGVRGRCQSLPRDRTRSDGQKLNHNQLQLTVRRNLCPRGVAELWGVLCHLQSSLQPQPTTLCLLQLSTIPFLLSLVPVSTPEIFLLCPTCDFFFLRKWLMGLLLFWRRLMMSMGSVVLEN